MLNHFNKRSISCQKFSQLFFDLFTNISWKLNIKFYKQISFSFSTLKRHTFPFNFFYIMHTKIKFIFTLESNQEQFLKFYHPMFSQQQGYKQLLMLRLFSKSISNPSQPYNTNHEEFIES